MTTLNARANFAYREYRNDEFISSEADIFEAGWEAGYKTAAGDMLGLLQILRAEAITSERKSAYDRAIEAVEGLS